MSTTGSCPYWREYDSPAGPICYCEVAAMNKVLSPEQLKEIGCTPEKRQACLSRMEMAVGAGAVPTVAYEPPKEIAAAVAKASEAKAKMPLVNVLLLGCLAGAYIAIGAQLSTMVTNDLAKFVGDGLSRLTGGMVFSVGLVMVILCGAELFTGNNLVMALGLYDRKISWGQLLRNWGLVYLANFLGAMLLVYLVYQTDLWTANGALVGAKAVATAQAKVNLTFAEAFSRGILCNWLVCLAVWLANAGRDAISKMLGIILPITAFVASGFEHSVANMYFIPMGLLLKNQAPVVAAMGGTATDTLTWGNFLVDNLIPVTLGNIVGGAIFVAGIYWVVYLRQARPAVAETRGAGRSVPGGAPLTGERR